MDVCRRSYYDARFGFILNVVTVVLSLTASILFFLFYDHLKKIREMFLFCSFIIKILNQVVDICSTDMLCSPTLDTCMQRHVGHFRNMMSIDQIQDGRSYGSMYGRGQHAVIHFLGGEGEKPMGIHRRMKM